MTDLDPAAIMADHAGHGSQCGDFYIGTHCLQYRLAAANAALREQIALEFKRQFERATFAAAALRKQIATAWDEGAPAGMRFMVHKQEEVNPYRAALDGDQPKPGEPT